MMKAPRVFAYCRQSESSSVATSHSCEAQIARAETYHQQKLPEIPWAEEFHPVGSRPGFFIDRGVSAYGKSKLDQRPAGAKLLAALRKGDHVMVWSVDRMFRDVGDFGTTLSHFQKRGIIVHFIHEGIDLSTASGQLKAAICAVLAEHWSRMISFRAREAHAIKAARLSQKDTSPDKLLPRRNSNDLEEICDLDIPTKIVAVTPSKRLALPQPSTQTSRSWGYIRVSSTGQVESGLGLEHQRQRVEKHMLELGGEHLGIVTDEAISSFKIPFAKRPGGSRILAEAKPGDSVVVYRFDRIFRSLQDMANTIALFRQRGINLCLVEEGIQTNRRDGDWYLNLLGTFAELESTLKSERVREAKSKLKQEGRKYTRQLLCYRSVKINGSDRLVLSGVKLVRFRMGHILWKEMGFTKDQSAHIVNAIVAQTRGSNWHNFIFVRDKKLRAKLTLPAQIQTTLRAWPELTSSLGEATINRLDQKARQLLAIPLTKETIANLKSTRITTDQLKRWFVVRPTNPPQIGVDEGKPSKLHDQNEGSIEFLA